MRESHVEVQQADAAIEVWLAGLTRTYGLTDLAARRWKDMDACRLTVATSDGVYRVEGDSLRATRLLNAQETGRDVGYTSLVSTPSGALAYVNSLGKLTLIDTEGIVTRMRQVADTACYMTHAQWRARSCFLLSGLTNEIRMLDAAGDLMFRLRVPGMMLPFATYTRHGELWLAGGVRGRQQVYLWNLSHILEGHAEPPVVLGGGSSPAYMTRFITLGEQCWLAHSCWDGDVYLYPQPWRAHGTLAPAFALHSPKPLYAIEPMVVRDRPYLFGGTEDGRLLAWALDSKDLDGLPALEVARLNAPVKRLSGVSVAGQAVLFAGCGDGRLAMLKLPGVMPAMPLTSARIGQGPVCGIGFSWPAEYEMVA
jgi:hypothetical protein